MEISIHLFITYGTIHLRHWQLLGGEGAKIGQICQQIDVKMF